MSVGNKKVEYLVVDTTAFIQNAPLQEITENAITCQEVVDEITSKRQLRRLTFLPYDLQVKDVFPENIKAVTNFAIQTGDYPSLSATDIKVMALTYQLEKEKVGVDHIRTEPIAQRSVNVINQPVAVAMDLNLPGFYWPKSRKKSDKPKDVEGKETKTGDLDESASSDEEFLDSNEGSEKETEVGDLGETAGSDKEFLDCNEGNEKETKPEDLDETAGLDKKLSDFNLGNEKETEKETVESYGDAGVKEESELYLDAESDDILVPVKDDDEEDDETGSDHETGSDDDEGWITPYNVNELKKKYNAGLFEEKHMTVACMTTDFAMQNVLKQMNLNVAALDGRMIKQVRTFILRCYACFKTTSVMTKVFCPKCGNKSLKKVGATVDENGKQQIFINGRRPVTGKGKRFSKPRIKGGKHPQNPIIVPDQPMPHNELTKKARTKLNPLDDDYIAGYSPFAPRDVTSRSAQLHIRPTSDVKYWMRNDGRHKRRK